ncbi:MAG: phage holin [Lachnospiraceae bacterium]|nr:phage holin [Lachnospiraceae bacterium]
MINWKVRIKNKTFWITLIPALILLVQAVAAVFGVKIDLSALGSRLVNVVEATFVVLAIVGVITDPTTTGVSDSRTALTYEAPKEDK